MTLQTLRIGKRSLTPSSGADAIVLIDLNQADAENAAKDLVEWFGEMILMTYAYGLQNHKEKRLQARLKLLV